MSNPTCTTRTCGWCTECATRYPAPQPSATTVSELRASAVSQTACYKQYAGHFDNYVLAQIVSQKGLRKRYHKAMFPIGLLVIASPVERTSEDVNGKSGTFRTVWAQGYGDISLPTEMVKLT